MSPKNVHLAAGWHAKKPPGMQADKLTSLDCSGHTCVQLGARFNKRAARWQLRLLRTHTGRHAGAHAASQHAHGCDCVTRSFASSCHHSCTEAICAGSFQRNQRIRLRRARRPPATRAARSFDAKRQRSWRACSLVQQACHACMHTQLHSTAACAGDHHHLQVCMHTMRVRRPRWQPQRESVARSCVSNNTNHRRTMPQIISERPGGARRPARAALTRN